MAKPGEKYDPLLHSTEFKKPEAEYIGLRAILEDGVKDKDDVRTRIEKIIDEAWERNRGI